MKFAAAFVTSSFLSLLTLSSVLAAEEGEKTDGNVAQACRQDLQKLCPDVKLGDGRIKSCIRKNHSKLSDACKEAIKDMRKKSEK